MVKVTIELSQELKEKFLQHMTYRLTLKDLVPEVNPADAVLLIVAQDLVEREGEMADDDHL